MAFCLISLLHYQYGRLNHFFTSVSLLPCILGVKFLDYYDFKLHASLCFFVLFIVKQKTADNTPAAKGFCEKGPDKERLC